MSSWQILQAHVNHRRFNYSPGNETTLFYPFHPLGRKLGPKFFEIIVFTLIKSKGCTKKYAADLLLWPHKGR